MATEEHKYLANIIKNTHATLREEAENYGPEIAWKRHVKRKDILQKYASSMHKLATKCWIENNVDTKNSTYSRIEWIKLHCEDYFLNGGRQKYDTRERDIQQKIDSNLIKTEVATHCNLNSEHKNQISNNSDNNLPKPMKKISLLDVGSCFNPFGTLDMFEVTAIDLNGVPNKVLSCDFLNVQTGEEKILSSDSQEILQLPENFFDVVVFSLFLEYLPCPKQRYNCCKKAYDLLQNGGILFVISPDSKHVNANVKIVKSWRYVLSKLGFMRIKYEKLRHMHCIVFRKCEFKHVASRWADLQTPIHDDVLYTDITSFYIPQDFRNASRENEEYGKEEYDSDEVTSMFNELPFEQL